MTRRRGRPPKIEPNQYVKERVSTLERIFRNLDPIKWERLLALVNATSSEVDVFLAELAYSDLRDKGAFLREALARKDFPKRQRARQGQFLALFIATEGRVSPRRARRVLSGAPAERYVEIRRWDDQ